MTRPAGFRPGQLAYQRIRWDERLARRPFVLVIEDRPAGTKRIPFAEFIPGGEVPWHRLQQICLDGHVVWCREQRIDRLDELADRAPRPAASGPTPEPVAALPDLVALTPTPPTQPSPPVGPTFRVATFNALCDAFDADLTDPARRRPAIVRELAALDADLIGVSEASPELLDSLRSEPWVAERYHLSDDAAGVSVRPHGQLLLSRWPLRSAAFLPLTPHRRVLCCEVEGPTGSLRVLVLHLVSNATPDAARRRREELGRVLALVSGAEQALVVGDFNLDEHELAEELRAAGLRDAWREALPDDPGATFDPERNALAALFSREGRPRRFDRVLLRSESLAPCTARLFATSPLSGGDAGLFASDHFGVVAELRRVADVTPIEAAPTGVQSALVVLAEGDVSALEALRAERDKGFGRWMPHLTLMYGFLPASLGPEVLARVAAACRASAPFRVTLEASGRFDHAGSSTMWLDPRSGGALEQLHAALARELPGAVTRGEGAFRPHLTVARFAQSQRAEAQAFERELRRAWTPRSFEVREVHWLVRRGAEPFASVARVELGTGTLRGGSGVLGERDPWAVATPTASEATLQRREQARAVVEAAGAALASARGLAAPAVETIGGARLYPEDPDTDLDLVLICPRGLAAGDALAGVAAALQERGDLARLALEARHPSVRAEIDGVEVDLTAYEERAGGPVGGASEALPAHEQAARLGLLDALALEDALGELRPRWSLLRRVVKRWLQARGLKGQWAGYPGGIAWSVLAARVVLDRPSLRGSALVARFFAEAAGWPWPAPVSVVRGVTGAWLTPPAQDGLLPVMAPSLPWRDTSRTVLASTRRALLDELRRAAAITASVERHQAAAGELWAPYRPSTAPLASFEASDAEQRGQLTRDLLGHLARLEAQGAAPRPCTTWRHEHEKARLDVFSADVSG